MTTKEKIQYLRELLKSHGLMDRKTDKVLHTLDKAFYSQEREFRHYERSTTNQRNKAQKLKEYSCELEDQNGELLKKLTLCEKQVEYERRLRRDYRKPHPERDAPT